jgi:hypothetical protein
LAYCTFNTYLSILYGECAQKLRFERGPDSALDVLLDAATEVAGLRENDHGLKVLISYNVIVRQRDFIEQIRQDTNFELDVLPDAVTNLGGNGIECYKYEAIITFDVVNKTEGSLPPYSDFRGQ